MHELSICQALVRKMTELAREHSASRVVEARIAIGPLSGVEPRLIENAYPLACAGTPAEGSRLAIEQRPLRVRCQVCNEESPAASSRLVCAHCGDWRTDLIGGDELLLLQVEFEMDAIMREASHV